MFGCQQILIKPDPKLKAVREYICQQSNKLHNCAVYGARQMYFKRQTYVRPFDLINEPKRHPQWGALCDRAAQQTCGAVGESVKSIKGLIKLFWDGNFEHKPRFPKNRKHRNLIAYPKQALGKKMIDRQI